MSKRWPVLLGIVVAFALATTLGWASDHFWIGALVYVATAVVWAALLRYVGGLPWSRILWHRESRAC